MGKTEEQKANAVYADYFTRVPNILFESYKYLTKEETLLYIRLRYIYWDTKPRYLSLRELADKTGYSTGALSKMLPRLNTVGLIHAEVRKKKAADGKEKGNPLYHLTINDVWEENRRYFTEGKFDPSEALLVQEMNTSCSPNEQDTAKPVHQMNKPVHKTNDLVQEMNNLVSFGEQDHAQNGPYKTIDKITNKTSTQEGASQHFDAPPAPADFLETDSHFEDDSPTVYRLPAIKLNGAPHETTEHPPVPATALSGLEICSPLSPATREDAETHVAIANTLGEPDFPPSVLSRQSHTPLLSSPADGATAEDHSGPRASWTQEDEPQIKPETKAERKRRIEQREKEIWALVEAQLETKFSKTQRQSDKNKTGMEHLIEDEADDQTIKKALEALDDFYKRQFNLKQFHEMMPGLLAPKKQPKGKLADKSPQNVRDVQYEAALQKIGKPLDEEVPAWLDFDNYVGNGPEERQRWIERGRELKALGYCPDLD